MTESEAKARLCVWAESQIGYHEKSNNANQYADDPDLQRLYGWAPQNQPWCDVFVDAGFIACFGVEAAAAMTYQPMGAGSALCSQSAAYYQERGAWSQRPEIGDQVFFYVSGGINHTGIVIRVEGSSVVTVEGNSSDQVAERVYQIADVRIAGYGRPDWTVVANGPTVDTQAPEASVTGENDARCYILRLPYLCRGSIGAPVTAVQFQLMGQGYNVGPDGADGDFGGNTEEAVKEFQLNVGLTPDGTVGPDTGARLFGGEPVNSTELPASEAKPETVTNTKSGLLNRLAARLRGGH
jgi:hypothetical protein